VCNCNELFEPPPLWGIETIPSNIPFTGKQIIPLCITLEEAQDMITMLHAAKRAFCDCGDDFASLHRLLNALRFVGTEWWIDTPEELLECVVPICEQVALCITDDEQVSDALQDWLDNKANPYNPNSPLPNANGQIPESELTKNLAPVGCNSDAIYGQILNVIQELNEANIDALEIFVAESGLRKNVANLIEAVPLVGEFPIDDILEYTSLVVDFLKANYESAYTGALEEEIVCDIFCQAKSTCTVNYELLFEYFKSKVLPVAPQVQQVISLATLVVALASLTAGGFPPVGRIVVDIMMFAQLGLIKYANQAIGGMTFGRLTNYLTVGAGFENDDWIVICDNCDEPVLNAVWRFNLYEFQQFVQQGAWSYGTGVSATDNTDNADRRRVLIGVSGVSPALSIVSIKSRRSYVKGNFNVAADADVLAINGVNVSVTQSTAMPASLSNDVKTFAVNNPAVSSFQLGLTSDRVAIGGVRNGVAIAEMVDIEFGGMRPQWAVGKGYPVDASCGIWVFQTSSHSPEWQNYWEFLSPAEGQTGGHVAGVGYQSSVSPSANPFGHYVNYLRVHLKSATPFTLYGFVLVYSSSVGLSGGGTNNIRYFKALRNGISVWNISNSITNQSNQRHVAYNEVLVDEIVIEAVAGSSTNRNTLVSNAGNFAAHSLLLRYTGNPSYDDFNC